MLFEFGFYSSILLIFFSQGIIYSILLLKKAIQTNTKAYYWLSLFVGLCSLYIAPWMLGFAGWYDKQPYRDILFYLPLQHLFFIGPIIYCYTQSLLNPSFKFNIKQALHLVPGMLYLLYIFSIWFYDKVVFQDYYFYQNGMDKDFDNWYQKLGLASMIVYFVASIKYYNSYKKLMYQVVSYADSVLFKWIKTYLIAFLIMLLLPVLFDSVGYFFPELKSYKGSWWFFLFFAVIMLYIAIVGYANPVHAAIPFQMTFNENPILLLHENQTTEESVIDIAQDTFEANHSPEIAEWKIKIETLIHAEKLYQNPELNITEVAKKLDTNVAVISKAINQGFQMNFNDFINSYRIEAVKIMFSNFEHKKSTLLGIAFDCGFNSKATFNRAFKKTTGISPKEYLKGI